MRIFAEQNPNRVIPVKALKVLHIVKCGSRYFPVVKRDSNLFANPASFRSSISNSECSSCNDLEYCSCSNGTSTGISSGSTNYGKSSNSNRESTSSPGSSSLFSQSSNSGIKERRKIKKKAEYKILIKIPENSKITIEKKELKNLMRMDLNPVEAFKIETQPKINLKYNKANLLKEFEMTSSRKSFQSSSFSSSSHCDETSKSEEKVKNKKRFFNIF